MDFDAIVVGAGPGGLIAARNLAKAGFQVGVFEKAGKRKLGKTIIIEIEESIFDRVNFQAPLPEEIPYHAKCMRWFAPSSKEVFAEYRLPCVAVFLDKVVKRMARDAEKAGAKIFGSHKAVEPIVKDNRVCGVKFETKNIKKEITARLVIDATGFDAVLARQLGSLGIEFEDHPGDVVEAANWLHEIDEAKAKEALENKICGNEEVWVNGGKGGNYSTEFYHLSMENKRAYLLLGLKEEYNTDFKKRYEDFLDQQGYFGKLLSGGSAKIRIRHSLPRLVADGFMVLGEAACMVIPAHGSGAASAMWAGHLASNTAILALKQDDTSTEMLWPYARQYQSERGAVLACYSIFRFFLESIDPERFRKMLDDGFVQGEDYYHSAVPEMPTVAPASIPGRLCGLLKHPQLLGGLVRTFSTMNRVKALYESYPSRYDPDEFQRWRKKEKTLFRPFMPGR